MRLFDATTAFLVAIILVLAGTGTFLYFQLRSDQVTELTEQGDPVNLLVTIHEEGRSILSFVLFMHPQTRKGAILDIPPNIGTVIPGKGQIDAIESALTGESAEEYRRLVTTLLGDVQLFRLDFDPQGLSDFVDLVGGVEMFVIADYRDLGNVDPLLLPSGNVLLDGPKALAYLTSSVGDNGELESVSRRQSFSHAFLRAISRSGEILINRTVRPTRNELFRSDLDSDALDALFNLIGDLNVETLVRRRVQGTDRTVQVGGESKTLLFPHFEGQWLRQSVQQIIQAIARVGDEEGATVVITMEVLNGTGASGLARRTSQLLEGFGFEVIRFGNAEQSDVAETLIIDRRGDGELARQVAQAIRAEKVESQPSIDSDVDVTLILGKDFDGTVVRQRTD